MIRAYIKERRSWIVLLLSMQGLLLFVSYVDPTIPVSSILYIHFLSIIISFLFLLLRYKRETTFYQQLKERDPTLDLDSVADSQRPFEVIVEESMRSQIEQLKQQLFQNQQQVTEEKDDLLSWIHEVKTPLTAMQLMIERVEDENLKARLTYEWLRIHLLLDQQLHQKRLPFMENDLFIEKTSLESIMFQEIHMLRSWCIQKNIGFDVDLESDIVLTDAKWLAFLIRQLLTNSIKYSEASDIVIKSFQHEEQTVLILEDFGCGISTKDLPRIFDKGFTSTTQHQNHVATGMGLYLAKKIAKSLRLKLEVQSELGNGTRFTLTFPKANAFIDLSSM
ncbi:sensor histidine kinase [Halalkalibacter krulwichiae]|uniref:histidine kinase n=1 Tax=Halalkalibacter krulwichiae TaxID=199441 RepID=A0A1X9MGU5_9BACI|nr:sensor histidine kinase [Halalkalibacter krulwichiae]ARK32658.1 Sensor histidine kinase GraS [Halalkalibacter krulwichiae]